MRKPSRVAMLVGAAGALTLGGTTAALAALGGSQQPQTTASYGAASNAAATASPTAGVSPDRARQIALQRVPGATVTETEFDHEHGRAVWEVDLTKQHREYEVHVDAVTGTVVSVRGASTTASAAPSAPSTVSATKVSAHRARQIALQCVPGGRITDAELDHEHGRMVWEIDLTTAHREYDVHVDAATGNVLTAHYDTETDDAD